MATFEILTNLKFNKMYIINMLRSDDFNTANRLYEDIMHYPDPGVLECVDIKTSQELTIFMEEQKIEIKNGLRPIYHFESHGNEKISSIGDDEHITWRDLSVQLSSINRETDYAPFVFMACCKGYHAISAITMHNLTPFYYLFGPTTTITVDNLMTSTNAFYKNLFLSKNLEGAISQLPANIGVYCAEEFFIKLRIKHLSNQHIGVNLSKHAVRLAEEYERDNILDLHPRSYTESLIFFHLKLNDLNLLEENYLNHARIFLGKEPSLSFSQIYDMAKQYYCSGK